MAEAIIKIDTSRLLWRTRGRRWDYTFVTRPRGVEIAGWMNLFQHVFGSSAAEGETRSKTGRLRRGWPGGVAFRYIAAAMTDPACKDFADRPIQHFFLYVLEEWQDERAFPEDWQEQLRAALAPSLAGIFQEERGQDELPSQFSARLFSSFELPIEVALRPGTPVAPLEEVAEFVAEEEKKTSAPSPPSARKDTPGWVWALLGIVLLGLLWRSCQKPSDPDESAPGATRRVTSPKGSSINLKESFALRSMS